MGSLEGGTADAVAAQRRMRRLCDLCCRWQRKEEALVELELVVQLELVQLEVRQQRQPRQQRQQRQKMQMQRKKFRRRQASGGCHPPSSSVSLQPRRRSGCAPFRSADTNAFRMSPFLKILGSYIRYFINERGKETNQGRYNVGTLQVMQRCKVTHCRVLY